MDIFYDILKKNLFIYLNPLKTVVKNTMKYANLLLLLTAFINSIIKAIYDIYYYN